MLTEHPDAQLLALGVEYEQFASDCDKLCENAPSDPEELVREEERLSEEGYRLCNNFAKGRAETLNGVAVYFSALGHCLRWDESSIEDRLRQAKAADEVLLWQIIASLPAILDQLSMTPAVKRETVSEAA